MHGDDGSRTRPEVNELRIDPALTVDDADIDGFIETFETVLGDVEGP